MSALLRLLVLLWCSLVLPAQAQPPAKLTVFAAASLQEGMDEVAALWTRRSGQRVVVSYAGSPALARQIEQGAPADVFVSADVDWMDALQRQRRIVARTRFELAGNRLVLVAPASSRQPALALSTRTPLARLLGPQGRLAVADTATVPAGRYVRQALQHLGLWPQVEDRLAESDSVRMALAYVARGEAPLGIVYATDAKAEPRVRVLAVFAASMHAPIRYPVAAVGDRGATRSAGFLAFLRGAEARAVFLRHGFTAP